jgi:hypothetical protein
MAVPTLISDKQFVDYLLSEEPVYDKEILRDVTPANSDLMGYYQAGTWDAYSGVTHTYDRFNQVFPDLTKSWNNVVGGMGVECTGAPCDPDQNKITWGYTRRTVSLQQQSWATDLICFDQAMTKTRAKEHMSQIINDVLTPASRWISNFFLHLQTIALAGTTIAIAPGYPVVTANWDAGGYQYLNFTDSNGNLVDPTGILTAPFLRSREQGLYNVGQMKATKDTFSMLNLQTDIDSFYYLCKQDPVLLSAWRFQDFGKASKEYNEYGFSGFVGNYMTKCLMFPLRFNRVSTGRYQLVLPYKNVATTEGFRRINNPDWLNAIYQFSYNNNPNAIRIKTYKAEALNAKMPYLIRDYAGSWKFAVNNLSVPNYRLNKGLFYADFRLAGQSMYPEWQENYFHVRSAPCAPIVSTCATNPGYPAQSYNSAPTPCAEILVFSDLVTNSSTGNYNIAANTIRVNGNTLTHTAINVATLALLVSSLQSLWTSLTLTGTWSIYSTTPTNQLALTGTTADAVTLPFVTN